LPWLGYPFSCCRHVRRGILVCGKVRLRDASTRDWAGRVLPPWSGSFTQLDRYRFQEQRGHWLGCLPSIVESILAHGFTGRVLDRSVDLCALESSFGALASIGIELARCSNVHFCNRAVRPGPFELRMVAEAVAIHSQIDHRVFRIQLGNLVKHRLHHQHPGHSRFGRSDHQRPCVVAHSHKIQR
jgi:hypothetical protein